MQATWTTATDGDIPLGAMSSRHIKNCIRYIQSGRMGRSGCNGFTNTEWVRIMLIELVKRGRQGR